MYNSTIFKYFMFSHLCVRLIESSIIVHPYNPSNILLTNRDPIVEQPIFRTLLLLRKYEGPGRGFPEIYMYIINKKTSWLSPLALDSKLLANSPSHHCPAPPPPSPHFPSWTGKPSINHSKQRWPFCPTWKWRGGAVVAMRKRTCLAVFQLVGCFLAMFCK